jgi:hypothetical protein
VISSGRLGIEHSVIGDASQEGAPKERNLEMTELVQTQPRNPALILAGVAVAATLLGGFVGNRVEAIVDSAADAAQAATLAQWEAYGKQWEVRYRAMYPESR